MKAKVKFLLMILLATLMVACSKDDDNNQEPDPQEESFDINNPEGYIVAIKQQNATRTLTLFKFLPNDEIKMYETVNGVFMEAYALINNNTIEINIVGNNIKITFEDEGVSKVTLNDDQIEGSYHLIKQNDENILAGNTYTGAYKIDENTDLHPNFFYDFHQNELKVDAGFEVGTPLRTDDYESIGNFAAYVSTPNPADPTKMDKELMVWLDGKLEVNYKNIVDGAYYYGSFSKQ